MTKNKNTEDSIRILKGLKQAEMPVDVLLFKERLEIGKLARLSPGSVLLFSAKEGDSASLRVQGKALAKGSIVQVDKNYGIELKEILSEAHD